ncbi:MAG: N-acetyltransferase family protein [Clostridia bacterium]
MNIRIATIKDAKEICEIYKYYVENTHISFEYIAPTVQEFEIRIANTLENYPYIVCEVDGKIVGYSYASRHMERASYSWNAVMTVYVDKNERGCGIGSELYRRLIEILQRQNIKNVYGIITSGNDKSIAMHQKIGFKINAVYHNAGFKNGKWLDVTWVEKNISEYDVPPKEFVPFREICKEF